MEEPAPARPGAGRRPSRLGGVSTNARGEHRVPGISFALLADRGVRQFDVHGSPSLVTFPVVTSLSVVTCPVKSEAAGATI